MDHAKLLQEAQPFKKMFEKYHILKLPYQSHDGKTYWCAKYLLFGKNSGFLILAENTPDLEEVREAMWNIGMVTSLNNGISAEIVEHYTKRLDYIVILEDLLIKWQTDYPDQSNAFSDHIQNYRSMVSFYEESMREIRQVHVELNNEADRIKDRQYIESTDVMRFLEIAANYNYLKYIQLLEQSKTVNLIRDIDLFLEKTLPNKVPSLLKELKKYTNYYINDKSLGYLKKSLSYFKKYGGQLAELPKKEGKALMLEAYTFEQKTNFEKEFMSMVRNKPSLRKVNDNEIKEDNHEPSL